MTEMWACSSVVEHCVDIAGVASSILATPTIQKAREYSDFPEFFYKNPDFAQRMKATDSGFVHGHTWAYLGTDWARPTLQNYFHDVLEKSKKRTITGIGSVDSHLDLTL